MEARLEQPSTIPVTTAVKLIVGGFLTLFGILMTLDNLGLLSAGHLLRYWPALLVIIGAIKFSADSGPIFGIVLMVAGGWMLLYNLHWIHFTIFQLWPLVVIGFGIAMIARALGWKLPRMSLPADGSHILAVLTSRDLAETSRDYRGGDVVVFLGGCRIDLSGAAITTGPAVLDVTAILGGIDIVVPEGWDVIGEVMPVMGGFEIKARPPMPRTGQLIVRGVAFMGGIEVKNVGRAA